MFGLMSSETRRGFLGLLAAVLVCAAGPAMASRKRRPANNEVCFNPALSGDDRSACKKQIGDATTAEDRNRIRKVYQQKINDAAKAKQATPPAP